MSAALTTMTTLAEDIKLLSSWLCHLKETIPHETHIMLAIDYFIAAPSMDSLHHAVWYATQSLAGVSSGTFLSYEFWLQRQLFVASHNRNHVQREQQAAGVFFTPGATPGPVPMDRFLTSSLVPVVPPHTMMASPPAVESTTLSAESSTPAVEPTTPAVEFTTPMVEYSTPTASTSASATTPEPAPEPTPLAAIEQPAPTRPRGPTDLYPGELYTWGDDIYQPLSAEEKERLRIMRKSSEIEEVAEYPVVEPIQIEEEPTQTEIEISEVEQDIVAQCRRETLEFLVTWRPVETAYVPEPNRWSPWL